MWALTEAGRRMPVNVEPDPAGNVVFTDRTVSPPHVRVLTKDELAGGVPRVTQLHMAHFATCPNVKEHRG